MPLRMRARACEGGLAPAPSRRIDQDRQNRPPFVVDFARRGRFCAAVGAAVAGVVGRVAAAELVDAGAVSLPCPRLDSNQWPTA